MTRRAFAVMTVALAIVACGPTRVEAQLGLGCTIGTTPLAFGTYDVLSSTPVDSTATVTYECLFGIPIIVTVSRGASSTFTPRTMTSGAETLAYNVYLNAARTTIWGDGTGGTSTYSAITILLPVIVTVFGRVPGGAERRGGQLWRHADRDDHFLIARAVNGRGGLAIRVDPLDRWARPIRIEAATSAISPLKFPATEGETRMRLMKLVGLMVGSAFLASLPLSAAEVTVKGEVVDQACFLKDKSRGADHKDCGTGCVKKGQPAAIVTADGEVYTLAGSYTENKNAKLVDLVAKTVEAKGEVSEKGGKKVLTATSIMEAK